MSVVRRHRRPEVLDTIPLDRHAVIEASAGTGKTYTIEHLVIELLLRTDATIDQILVVTFTEKATGELRSRVRRKIEELVHGPGKAGPDESAWEIGEAERMRLVSALSAFDAAPISTIHSFCQRVLTENAFDGSRLFEQSQVDGDEAFAAAFRESLRNDFARDPGHADWLAAWLSQSGVDALEKLLLECHRKRGVLQPALDEDALATLTALNVEGFDAAALGVELVASRVNGNSRKYVLQEITRLMDILRELPGAPPSAWLRRVASWRYARDGGADAWIRQRLASEALDGPQTRLVRRVLDVAGAAGIAFEAAIVDRFLPVVQSRLERRKRDLGLFDFDDMLVLVREGLSNERLVHALRERYRFALIDEFQDTDEVQWDIFRTVFFESEHHRLYLIGDPKQAIYRFRGADVHTYFQAKEAILAGGGAFVSLSRNFRSTAAVIDAYNRILEASANSPFFSRPGTYDEPVTCGNSSLQAVDGAGRALAPAKVVHLVAPGKLRIGAAREQLASYIAQETARLLDGRFLWRDEDGEKKLRAGDVFILTRTGDEGLAVGRALRDLGVVHAFYKQDGLFQTEEARDVCELLAAIVDPRDRSRRLRAWLTPFFGLGVEEAARARSVTSPHPLLERLANWHRLAVRRDFAALFGAITEESGIVRRLLLFESSERSLTNYQHLFELLLEESARAPHSADDLLAWLRGRIDGTVPGGEDGNVQRLETERDAVQIMTMHKSKGLEAAVVFLFGGFSASRSRGIQEFHDPGGRRVVHVGKILAPDLAAAAEREEAEEDERLLYVALTRAKARLYLPYFGDLSREEAVRLNLPAKQEHPKIRGAYRPVQERLADILAEAHSRPSAAPTCDGVPLFERDVVVCGGEEDEENDTEAALAEASDAPWSPPAEILAAADRPEDLGSLRRRHSGFVVTSYSRMKRSEQSSGPAREVEVVEGIEEPPALWAPPPTEGELPGGTDMGVFLHEVLELAPVDTFDAAPTLDAWRALPAIDDLLRASGRRHGIAQRHLPAAARLAHTALTAPVKLGSDGILDGIRTASVLIRELEFLYPIPEQRHPRLTEAVRDEGFRIERGFVKGFVDVIFTHRNRSWFADWKSDRLSRWDEAALAEHVERHYSLQARLYALALVKMLGIHDEAAYEARFGGLLYVFIRGMAPTTGDGESSAVKTGTPGVYVQRPSFAQIVRWDQELRDREDWGVSAR